MNADHRTPNRASPTWRQVLNPIWLASDMERNHRWPWWRWFLRNPFCNFNAVVIGVADCHRTVYWKHSPWTFREDGGINYGYTIIDGGWVPLPFVSGVAAGLNAALVGRPADSGATRSAARMRLMPGRLPMDDPVILRSQLEQAQSRIARLELDLAVAGQHAVNSEHEVHALRKEIQRLRMECDTERITRAFDPHDLKADTMTKQQISENTPWVIKTGVIAGLLLSGAIWFHSRLAAVEIAQEASKTKIDLIYEMVKEIKVEVKK